MSNYLWTGAGAGASDFYPSDDAWQKWWTFNPPSLPGWTLKRTLLELKGELTNEQGFSIAMVSMLKFGVFQFTDTTTPDFGFPDIDTENADWLWYGQAKLEYAFSDILSGPVRDRWAFHASADSSAQRKVSVAGAAVMFTFGLSAAYPTLQIRSMEAVWSVRCLYHHN